MRRFPHRTKNARCGFVFIISPASLPHTARMETPSAVLFDIDGVVIPEGQLYFSGRLARHLGIDIEIILPFYENEFNRCLVGQADLKEELQQYVRSWGWTGSIDELIEFWFRSERETDSQLLEDIKTLREKGIPCFIASNQEKHRAEYLLLDVGLSQHFDGAFFSCYIGCMKNDPAYFYHVLEKIGPIEPHRIYFWDNIEMYVEVAHHLGIVAHRYISHENFHSKMEPFLPLHD
jgi:putative hydrolase of the HAD superfamily